MIGLLLSRVLAINTRKRYEKAETIPQNLYIYFFVMLVVMLAAHFFLYMFAPLIQIDTSGFVENGVIMGTSFNAEMMIQYAIFKALPISLTCSVLISLICSLLFSRAMTKPIQQISAATERMEQLDKAARCPVDSTDEIGVLADNVNSLYASLLSTIENLEEEKKKQVKRNNLKSIFYGRLPMN